MLALFRTLAILLLLLVVAFASAILTMHLVIHGAEVTVPNLRGESVDSADAQTSDLGLGLHVTSRIYSDAVGVGRVLDQTPAAGTRLRKGWTMQVVESLGPQRVSVPDLIGVEERMAILDLHARGLQLGSVASLPRPAMAPNTVLAQSPEPGAKNIANPRVNLLLSGPAAPSPVPPDAMVMPKLTGMPLRTAERTLWTARLRLGKVSRVGNANAHALPAAQNGAEPARNSSKPGQVLTQSPQAGYAVAPNALVNLTVSR